MVSVRSFRRLPSGPLGGVACAWLCLTAASVAVYPAAAQTPAPIGPQTQPQTPTQTQARKAATRTALTASASASEAGDAVTFTAAVTAAGGVPTGTVTFKDGDSILGSAALSQGSARLTTSTLTVGRHTITAAYSGDASFAGSVAAALPHDVGKASTTIALTASGPASQAGDAVTFTAAVTAAGGVPTGTVVFSDGEKILGSAALAEGRAQLTLSTLPAGQHTLSATYGGDAGFRGSVSEPSTHLVQQNAWPVLVLLAAIVLAALMVLLRRIVFRWLLRPIARGLRGLFRSLRRVLRLGGRASVRQRPAESFLGLSVGAIAEGFTETEDAIADDFDPSSVQIDRHSRFVCSWIRPQLKRQAEYHRKNADEDFEKAKHLFAAEIPLGSNPLNVYDDIHNAFIVNQFSESDKPCFHILSEFRKTINSNVLALAVTYTFIVSAVAVANLTMPPPIEFYQRMGLGTVLPPTFSVPFFGIELSTATEIDRGMFSLMSCFLGFGLMWTFYNLAYEQSQRYNGQQMHTFLVTYLSDISNHFHGIRASATQAVVGDAEKEEMRRETVLWITNLHWMAFRMLFIEEFLRNILFQIRRNSAFALYLIVPLVFVSLLGAAFWLVASFELLDLGSNVHNYWFYPLFLWLLYEYGRYLGRALDPMSESIEEKPYTFSRLKLVDAMTRIMESYAEQLDQWRSRFRQGPGSQ